MKGIWYSRPSLLYRAIRACLVPLAKLVNFVDWRCGRPFLALKNTDLMALIATAEPGMVILTYTKHNLANLLIGGKVQHAALVLRRGLVVEATAKGVQIRSMQKLLAQCDGVVLMEPTFATKEQRMLALQFAVDQIGKEYDYDFEYSLSTNKSFYCSELVWWSYDQALAPAVAPFQPRKILGAWTLKPVDILTSEYWVERTIWSGK